MKKCFLCGNKVKTILTDTLRGGKKGNVYYCENCELGMLEATKKLYDYYRNQYRKDPLHKESDNPEELFYLYWNFQNDRINFIKKYLNKNTTLLEVGCSSGMFLYNVKPYTKRIVGIDYDLESGKFTSKKCNCIVFNTDIEDTDLPKESFDIICIFQTLEHVADPERFLKQYRQYLKPNGTICIEVPNIHDVLLSVYNLPNYRQFYFHPEHLWYFSDRSLLRLMDKSGFKGEVSFIEGYNLFNHINWINQDKPQGSCLIGKASPMKIPLRRQSLLSEIFDDFDIFYKRILEKLGATSDLFYIGVKK